MLISIIIPTFNRSNLLVEAVDSVLSQDFVEKEIIVVDDGSTDDTSQQMSQFGNKMIYIKIKNAGVSKARNIGIERARGEYIAFLDSDDLWLPKKLSYQMEYFEKHPEINICQTEEQWIRRGKRVNPKNIHQKYSGWIFEQCIPRCIISPSAVMLKRRVLDDVGLFDESMPVCEDYDLWLRTSLKYQIVTLPEPMIIKRGGHADQLSSQFGQDIWRIYALEKVLKNSDLDARLKNLVKEDIIRRARIVATGAKKRGKNEVAEKYEKIVERCL